MNTALVVACISGVVALASVGLSAWTQLQVTKRERQSRAEERRSAAKVVLDRYRGPLLDAAWQLGDRLDSIRHRGFLAYLAEGSGRERDAKLTALFRFAHYFGWREFVRTEVQLLRFENEEDTRSAAGFLDDVAEVLASDLLDGKWAMLWNDEQRGIGELMTERPSRTSPTVRGHAAFYRDYDKTFAPWMERFAGDLLSPAALKSDRLRLLQWALYGLVRQLDEEGTYRGVWIDRSASEIRQQTQHGSFTQHEQRMRDQYVGLAMPRINVRDARELLVDLPPPAEQHEIVNRVKQLLRLADKLEERIDSASQCVGWSIQAILAKAFRGDLTASPA